jgi:NAD(P)-dependent dehydrogenase (short-subunit alcohol dehydrogenase family)
MSSGKRAVINGGANGIGQAFCKRLGTQGAKRMLRFARTDGVAS